jgi:hypothetical protein
MPKNMTLYIDQETNDLAFTPSGELALIYDHDTTAQNVRLTLVSTVGQFFLDIEHGTEWNRVLGKKYSELEEDEQEEVMRKAILQETDVQYIDTLTVTHEGRSVDVDFEGTLSDGGEISLEVVNIAG